MRGTPTFVNRREQSENLDHLRQLVRLAELGGSNTAEQKMVKRLARLWEIDDAKLEKIRRKPGVVREAIPSDGVKKFRQLYDLVGVMLCDGKVTRSEEGFVLTRAIQMGYTERDVDRLIEKVKEVVREKSGESAEASLN